MGKRLEIKAGDKFGKWTVLEETEPQISPCGVKIRMFKCVCECGTVGVVSGSHMKSGHSVSCGCLKRELSAERCTTHGLNNQFRELCCCLNNIIARCTNPNCKAYKHYGARGIKVCSEWMNDKRTFIDWALANGWKKGLQIDRKNNDGDYTPDNCHFVEARTNLNNRRCTKKDNEGVPLSEDYTLVDTPIVSYSSFVSRVQKGMDVKTALTEPKKRGRLVEIYNKADTPAVSYSGFVKRVRAGWSLETALTCKAHSRRSSTDGR